MRDRRNRKAIGALLAACLTVAFLAPMAALAPAAHAAGDGWQNANGTSTTATGGAGAGGQPAKVFAFDTGQTVTACSSSQGTCVVGQPDGPSWFEVFATSPATTVAFSVTTAKPIACDFELGFKASFNGSTYVDEPSLPSDNHCTAPPPAAPCSVSNVSGYFEPVQAVWQDDPESAPAHFADKPGKRLMQTSPNAYVAELPMVSNKPTLLFGVDHDQTNRPKDRSHIVITGTTTGTMTVPVAMLFSGTGAGVALLHETPTLAGIDLDGPCGPPRDFRVALDATFGVPARPAPPFTFTGTGAYTLTDELRREDGTGTGIRVTVSGTVVQTKMPSVSFVPMRLTSHVSTTVPAPPNGLQAASDALADESSSYIPDYYPLRPGGMPVSKAKLIDARAKVAAELDSWSHWAASAVHLKSDAATSEDVLVATLTDSAQLGGTLGRIGRTIVVLTPSDFEALGGLDPKNGFVAMAVSQKVIIVRSDENHFTIAHELAHTLAYLWTSKQMKSQCDIDYHNADVAISLAHGFQVTHSGKEEREARDGWSSIMGSESGSHQWIDQCTYANLIKVLQDPPDPAVIVVRGRLARNGTEVAGELLPAYEMDGAVDLQAADGGDWALVARNAAGVVLGRFPFEPDWSGADFARDRNVISFSYRIPALAGVARVDLEGPGGVLNSRTWSAHAPTAKVTSPTTNSASKPAGGKVHVTWTGKDSDGDALLYTVLYSNDGGRTYQAQSVEQAGTSFDVTISTGVAHLVKIVVTDGARSAESVISFSSEAPPELVGRIASSYRAGTGAILLARLDPAVIDRYGSAQCRTFLASVKSPTLKYTVVSQSGPAPWNWVSDGKTTRIPAVFTLIVDRTEKSVKTRIQIHISIRSGRLAFFADCGKPA